MFYKAFKNTNNISKEMILKIKNKKN